MSTPERTIHQRMVDVLGELPAIGKNRFNEQQRFAFRGIDDVLNALNPLLAKHGVFYLPDVLERIDTERTTSSGKAMFVVCLHVRYTFYGEAGDSVSASAWGEGTDMGDKATPKAMTGAMKACLFQAFAISTEEQSDPDAHTPEESMPRTKDAASSGALSAEQRQHLWKLAEAKWGEQATTKYAELLASRGASRTTELKPDDYLPLVELLSPEVVSA